MTHRLDMFAYPIMYASGPRLLWYVTCQCGRLFVGGYPSRTLAGEMGRLHLWEYRSWHRAHQMWPQLR